MSTDKKSAARQMQESKHGDTKLAWVCRVCLRQNSKLATQCSAPMGACGKAKRFKELPTEGTMPNHAAIVVCQPSCIHTEQPVAPGVGFQKTASAHGRVALLSPHIENMRTGQRIFFADIVFWACGASLGMKHKAMPQPESKDILIV